MYKTTFSDRVQSNYAGLSFETISGSGPNGAIIHYKAEKETARVVLSHPPHLCP